MKTTRLVCVVSAPGDDNIEFIFNVCRSFNRTERLIERKFYTRGGGRQPKRVHHEMEIVYPTVWEQGHSSKIHYHTSKNGRQFVCWTGQLSTMAEVTAVLKTWCLGTAFTIVTGKDFVPETQRKQPFFKRMKRLGFEIKFIEEERPWEEGA